MSQGYKMSWNKYPCKIEDDRKIVRLINEPTEVYNPFDFYNQGNSTSLHMHFASINTANPENILDFVNKFGFLGLNIRNKVETMETALEGLVLDSINYLCAEGSSLDTKKMLLARLKNSRDIAFYYDNNLLQEEYLEDISNEITKFNNLLTLIELKDTSNEKELCHLLFNTLDAYSRYFFEPDYKKVDLDTLKLRANFCIRDTINKEIELVTPTLSLQTSSSNKFESQWNAKTLISALYTMLYLDLTQGKIIKKCKNITCQNFFEIYGIDNRKEFCSTRCAQAQASREYRKRIKKNKEKKV